MEPVYAILVLYAAAALFCAVIFLADPNLRAWVLRGPADQAPAAIDRDAEPRLPEQGL
jgi:hypothetical protein